MRYATVVMLSMLLGCEPAPAATDAGDAADCDPKVVVCRESAPTCPPGFVPSVEAECWGPCVDQLTCAPIDDGERSAQRARSESSEMGVWGACPPRGADRRPM